MAPQTSLRAAVLFLLGMGLAAAPGRAAEHFRWQTNAGVVALVRYVGPGGEVEIPGRVNGLPVEEIAPEAFADAAEVVRIVVPDSVESIGHQAFAYSTGLTNLVLGRGVGRIGEWALRGCSRLTAIEVHPENPAFRDVDGVLFNQDLTRLLRYPAAREGVYIVPDTVRSIGIEAFAHSQRLRRVVLPESLVEIGDWAFDRSGLERIEIPPGVVRIGDGAFSTCGRLAVVVFSEGLARIGSRAFERTAITDLTLPESLSHLGPWAFYGCRQLVRIAFPESFETIPARAFFNCAALAHVVLPEDLLTIEEWAFSACARLVRLTLPASLMRMGEQAFSDCPLLERLRFKGPPPEMGPDVFSGSPEVVAYYLEDAPGWGRLLGGRPTLPMDPAEVAKPTVRESVPPEAGTRPLLQRQRR